MPLCLLLTQSRHQTAQTKRPRRLTEAFSIRCLLGAAFVTVFTSEGLMRVDGYKSSRSGNERKGDQNKSEDFSHAHSLKSNHHTTRRPEDI